MLKTHKTLFNSRNVRYNGSQVILETEEALCDRFQGDQFEWALKDRCGLGVREGRTKPSMGGEWINIEHLACTQLCPRCLCPLYQLISFTFCCWANGGSEWSSEWTKVTQLGRMRSLDSNTFSTCTAHLLSLTLVGIKVPNPAIFQVRSEPGGMQLVWCHSTRNKCWDPPPTIIF